VVELNTFTFHGRCRLTIGFREGTFIFLPAMELTAICTIEWQISSPFLISWYKINVCELSFYLSSNIQMASKTKTVSWSKIINCSDSCPTGAFSTSTFAVRSQGIAPRTKHYSKLFACFNSEAYQKISISQRDLLLYILVVLIIIHDL